MLDGSPSKTARMVAALRSYYCLLQTQSRKEHDNLAMSLIGFEDAQQVTDYVHEIIRQFSSFSDASIANDFVFDMMSFVVARSFLVEDQLAKAHSQGISQLVILGAGLDSTAYRREDLTHDIQVFEVDHPATQAWKQTRLKECNITRPDNLTFVGFDFENQTLEQAFVQGGISNCTPTLFSWLGVQPYLTDATVMATLKVIGGFPSGSELLMDLVTTAETSQFADEQPLSDDRPSMGMQELLSVVRQMGEPFLSTYTKEEFKMRLQKSGFGTVIYYDSEAINKRLSSDSHVAIGFNARRTAQLLSARI